MKTKKRRWLVAACITFLLLDVAIFAVLGITVWRDQQANLAHERDALARQMNVSADLHEDDMQQAKLKELGEVYRYVTLCSEAQCKDGRIGIMLFNGAENPYTIKLQLIQYSTGEIIAETGLVDPGWRVETVETVAALAPGQYHCLARLHFYTMDGSALLGTIGRQVLLQVE